MKRFLAILALFSLPVLLYTPGQRAVSASSNGAAVSGDCKYVALTFDDGPRADTTSVLLDGLQARSVSATFFLIGEQIPGNEDLLRRMAAEGHQIGNHTYSHAILEDAADNAIVEEIHKTEVLLTDVLGTDTYWLRPPYGMVDRARTSLIKTPMIFWSLDPEDWRVLDAEKVTDTIVHSVQPGDIILLHDFYPTSVKAALQVIDRLQPQGYEFVTVEDLFAHYGTIPVLGELYCNATTIRTW